MKTDLEIEKECQILSIDKIANKLNISTDNYEKYGSNVAKLDLNLLNKTTNNSKLILVTSINPTPYGEGKTTISIGLNDALWRLGKKSIAVLREPSMGPVFGLKGGATGGGFSQVIPTVLINLHFTGDMHAITSCNNLLSAVIDSHIYNGNKLNIDVDNILFNRCIDINDRSLRNVEITYSNVKRKEHFNITAASEIMAILCLASDFEDLKNRLGKILVAYDIDKNPVYAYQLDCIDSLAILLKDALKPNLVQTLENNPAIIHGGPFANIAHGCNSLVATRIGLNLADYVITEAGFGSDLGAEKFFDIKCRVGNLKPNVIVINTTIRSLKYNGNGSLEKGIELLGVHIENMKKFLDNVVVCVNKFDTDLESEHEFLKKYCISKNTECIIVNSYMTGGSGALDLAQKIIELSSVDVPFNFLYKINDTIKDKINLICTKIYRANNVIYEDNVLVDLEYIEKNFSNLPICIAKTPYSLSSDSKKIGITGNFDIVVKDIKVNNGASFLVVYLSNVLTLPGMSENANIYNIKIDNNFNISGLK